MLALAILPSASQGPPNQPIDRRVSWTTGALRGPVAFMPFGTLKRTVEGIAE